MDSQEAWKKQRKIIKDLEKNNPELLEPKNRRKEADVFKEIGIWNIPQNKPKGYLRYFFEDFIVEEKTEKGEVIPINIFSQANREREKNEKTLYANMVKIGITTTDAIERLKQTLNFNGRIGYAGLKDEYALTAQLIAFRDQPIAIEDVAEKNILNLKLSDLHYGKDFLRPGDLEGNLFTITVRTEDKIDESLLAAKIDNIEKYGILNYYQSQRFGSVRLDSHKIGKLIMQGKYELAIRYILFKTNEYEMPLIAELKKEAEKIYPNFLEIAKIFERLPYSFLNELKIVEYLKNKPNNFIGALNEVKNSATICLYAYSSLLFNKYLSEYSREKGCVNEEFPLLLSDDPDDHKFYQKYLAEDGTENFLKNLQPLKFVYLTKRTTPGRIYPANLKFKIFAGGAVVQFFLRKGSYATTFLANLFELYEDKPVPEWVGREEIDAKELMGQGNLNEVREIFKDFWHLRID
ncbi:MAG: tRNA pseudouridine(13) synthase TruD [Patescibacteria group bacterium]|nr:tRNA pseudouridine(13) synthase TruD [Patescibacteria group bacterium]MDD4611110.1 tRNA pseudouridine(13) synthase TruD [Patescibacteria group bacterium]